MLHIPNVPLSAVSRVRPRQPTHDDPRLGDARGNALVREHRRAVDVQLVLDGDVVSEDSDVFHASLHQLRRRLNLPIGQRLSSNQ